MPLGQPLQRLEGTDHLQEVGIGISRLPVGRHCTYHKVAHPAPVQVCYISVPVAHLSAQGKEECGLSKGQRTAVGEQPVYFGTLRAVPACARQGRNVFD